jgi:hypothetical protein
MCGPLTAKVSLRCIASKIDARVFSSAQTPVRPAVSMVRTSMPASRRPDMRISMLESTAPIVPK